MLCLKFFDILLQNNFEVDCAKKTRLYTRNYMYNNFNIYIYIVFHEMKIENRVL